MVYALKMRNLLALILLSFFVLSNNASAEDTFICGSAANLARRCCHNPSDPLCVDKAKTDSTTSTVSVCSQKITDCTEKCTGSKEDMAKSNLKDCKKLEKTHTEKKSAKKVESKTAK